jgi:P2-related tail formation protein
MGQVTDLIPFMYHSSKNELIGFVEQFEPEIERTQNKIKGISALSDIDRCPDEFLPYLAALTNCQLIGDDPRLWRR